MDRLGALEKLCSGWANCAVVVGRGSDILWSHGDTSCVHGLASVTKPLVATAVLVAIEEGAMSLEDKAGPPGSTLRHLLAHASGLAPDSDELLAAPGTRRIYSNRGFEVVGEVLEDSTGIATSTYLREAVVEPLGLRNTTLTGSPAHSAVGTCADLALWLGEVSRPRLLDPSTIATATEPHFAGLDGVLPGFGRQVPNPWGLGFEVRGHKNPHWTGTANSPRTFGHFGRSGSFVWVDPDADLFVAAVGGIDFGPWAVDLWPRLNDALLDVFAA